jgi:hypothetical protein
MNGKCIGALLVIVAVGFTMLSCGRQHEHATGTQATNTKPVEWEYKVIYLDTKDDNEGTQKKMNELGKDGWEYAGVVTTNTTVGNWSNVCFKRPKR